MTAGGVEPALPAQAVADSYHFEHNGFCPVCETPSRFVATSPYFRSSLRCSVCKSAPRHRALMHVLSTYWPNWRNLRIHESSPGWDRVSARLANECAEYTASQYDLRAAAGSSVETRLPCKTYLCEDLEHQTFADESFDLFICQDVFEHLFHPNLAIKEIARTLATGGGLLMTVPIVMKSKSSRRRAKVKDGIIEHIIEPAEYHGSPVDSEGALVTIDWGYDIVSYLQQHSGLSFMMINIDKIDLGIRADLIEVLVAFKRPQPAI